MAVQFSVAVRNARLDAIEAAIGASPTLELRTGAPPANCAAADTGTVLATIALPADWMDPAAGGAKALAGTWQDLTADASGSFGHFRIKQGGACGFQGTCGTGGADLVMDSASVMAGQQVSIVSFNLTEGGA